jgi:hypothetical protein
MTGGQDLPGGTKRETATGEGKASKGARVDGNGKNPGARKGPQERARNSANPGSAAGCNKPAKLRAEQTIKAVRNREGGTGPARWQRQADVRKQKRKATSSKQKHRSGRKEPESMDGRSLETPRELSGRKVR